MTKLFPPTHCPLCGGAKRPGKTTVTVDLESGVVVIRDVPALICAQCGADWILDGIAARVEAIVEDAKRRRLQVEVTTLA